MRSPDEIKKGLECCATVKVGGVCPFDCPLQPLCASGDDGAVQREILALIQQLQAENAEQAERIKQLEAERDALVNDIRTEGGLCALCKHEGARAWSEPCCRCNALIISGESHWEWRGIQKEE